MPSNSPPIFCTPSTSIPSIVSRSASSSGGQSKSTYCLSQLSVTFILELPQKPQIIFVKQPDVVNAVPNHCDPLDAEPEGPTRPHLSIVSHVFEHLRVHHPAAGDFEPFLAHFARDRAAEINFEARFRVAEVMRTETDTRLRPHQFLEHELDRALEVAHSYVSV